jgi:hypothetical protein
VSSYACGLILALSLSRNALPLAFAFAFYVMNTILQTGDPVYSWKRTKIQAYRLPLRILGETRAEVGRQEESTSTSTRRSYSNIAIAATAAVSPSSPSRQHSTVETGIDMTISDLEQPPPPPQIPLLSGFWIQRSVPPLRRGRIHRDHADPARSGIVQISRQRFLPRERQGRRGDPEPAPSEDAVIQDLLLNGQVPVYESLEMPHPDEMLHPDETPHPDEMPHPLYHQNFPSGNHSSKLLKFSLPPGVVANVIVVTLIGKNHEQVRALYLPCSAHRLPVTDH